MVGDAPATVNPTREVTVDMSDPTIKSHKPGERVAIPLDPEQALRGLMQAGPHREPDAE